uniref:ATP-dependent Clp protease proteolytic subunit n=1 Tax=Lotus japonicus TaxID=34305 RepID=I3T2P9_LOTJA|nr:unknown [Lotus japonicus]
MAVAPYTTGSAPRLCPPSSCATKIYTGLKPQSASPFGAAIPNVNAEFYAKVDKTLQCRYANHKPVRARIQMVPIGTPRVPYRTPGEGTWQWVDIWNALYRERVIFIGQEIDEEFSNQILATMLYLDSVDNAKRLYMYINGPGWGILHQPWLSMTPCRACKVL